MSKLRSALEKELEDCRYGVIESKDGRTIRKSLQQEENSEISILRNSRDKFRKRVSIIDLLAPIIADRHQKDRRKYGIRYENITKRLITRISITRKNQRRYGIR